MIGSLCWPHASCGRMNDTWSCTKPASTKLPWCCFWNTCEPAEPHQSPGTSPVQRLVAALLMQLYLVRGRLTKSHLIMESGQSDLLLVKSHFSPYIRVVPQLKGSTLRLDWVKTNTWSLLSFVSFLAGSLRAHPWFSSTRASRATFSLLPLNFGNALPFGAH